MVVYGLSTEPEQAEVLPLGAALGGNLTLQGYSIWPGQAEDQSLLYVTIVWQTREPVGQDYKVFVHLVDSDGKLVAQRDSEPLNGLRPTTSWAKDEEIADRLGLWLPPDLPPGEYQILVGMYNPETLERLSVLDEAGKVTGDSIPLGSVTIPADH